MLVRRHIRRAKKILKMFFSQLNNMPRVGQHFPTQTEHRSERGPSWTFSRTSESCTGATCTMLTVLFISVTLVELESIQAILFQAPCPTSPRKLNVPPLCSGLFYCSVGLSCRTQKKGTYKISLSF